MGVSVSWHAIKNKALDCLYMREANKGKKKCFSLQDDVLLEAEDLYYLLLKLPETVDEDTASAVFNKKKQRLTLTVDVL